MVARAVAELYSRRGAPIAAIVAGEDAAGLLLLPSRHRPQPAARADDRRQAWLPGYRCDDDYGGARRTGSSSGARDGSVYRRGLDVRGRGPDEPGGRMANMTNPPRTPVASAAPANRYASAPEWRAVDDYFAGALVGEDDALARARESSARTTMPHAEVAAHHGAFLGLIAEISGARRVLEFGTLAGYSTIWLARAVGDDGAVVTLELDAGNADVARQNFHRAGVADRIELIEGPAADSAQRLIDGGAAPFDLVFIDADKPSNPLYLEAALALTRSGSVIVIDNVVRDGAVVDGDSADPRVIGVRQVVAMIAAHADLTATALQTVGVKGWDGVIVARRR